MSSISKIEKFISNIRTLTSSIAVLYEDRKFPESEWMYGCLDTLIEDWKNRLPAKPGDHVELLCKKEISDENSRWYCYRKTFEARARATVVDVSLSPKDDRPPYVTCLLKFDVEYYNSHVDGKYDSILTEETSSDHKRCFTFNINDVKKVLDV